MKKKNIALALCLLFFLSFFVTACGGNKKCNGKRGVRTQMGPM